ncbi:MAG TPA: hypothetical protein VKN99_05335 [Polyangia bacterium]|nr:hypothetical protein [Polyangia bacterium]
MERKNALSGPSRPSELTLCCGSCGTRARPLVQASGATGLELRCRFCGARVEIAPDPVRPVVRAQGGCPKCGTARAELSCPRCGLIYARWRPDETRASPASASGETARLWAQVQEDFLAPARHERFLAHCLHAGSLGSAAAWYAEEEASPDLERASIAGVRRRQIRALVEAAYLQPRGDQRSRRGATTRKVTLFAGTLALVSLVLWMGSTLARARTVRAQRQGAAVTLRVPHSP